MSVWFVGAGPGDPELLTQKAARLLQSARCCIWAGSLIHPQILTLLPQECDIHDSAKMTLDETTDVIADCTKKNIDVVRLHTGEPAIYGAIAEQMDRLDELNIPYEVVPGISSFQAAAAALKVELTLPEETQTVILSRTSGRTPLPETEELENLAAIGATLCLFLSAGKLDEVCKRLSPFYGEDCPAALVYHASWPDQVAISATLSTLPQQAKGYERTALILVGRALAKKGAVSKLYDASFTHGYREANTDGDCPATGGKE